jgi:hypothetical protein
MQSNFFFRENSIQYPLFSEGKTLLEKEKNNRAIYVDSRWFFLFFLLNISYWPADIVKAPHAPIKAMMFDFQTLRYSSPMIDLVTFMANSTGTDVRSTHFSFIFKTYHEEVIKTLMFALKKSRHEIADIYK